jgi:hypothetical protein
MAKSPLAVKRKSTLSAYKPSLREKAAILGEKGFKAVMGREPGYEARENINRYTGLLDLLDVPGMALSADDARRNIQSKQYGAAAGDIAALAVGAIPIAGGALKGGAKKAVKEGVEGAADLVKRYIPSSSGEPLTVYHGSRTGATGDFKPFTHDETNLPGVAFSTNKNVADRYANDAYNRAEYGDKITPALTKARIRGAELPTIDDFYNQAENYYKKDFSKITPQEKLNFAKSKGITALNTEAIGEKGEVFVLDPSAIETGPFEDLAAKYELPPVITGAEREANLARFMEGSHPLTRNADGSPKTFYHGTKADIESFDPEKIANSDLGSIGQGFYASEHPDLASFYSSIVPVEGNPNVMPIHINAKNPYVYDLAIPFKDKAQSKEFTDKLKEMGHDAIVRYGRDGSIDEIVSLYPEKMKSKFNIGTFNPEEPHLSKARGGLVRKYKVR